MADLSIPVDQSHGEVHVNDTLTFRGKSWRVARIEPGPDHYGYRVAGAGLREALTLEADGWAVAAAASDHGSIEGGPDFARGLRYAETMLQAALSSEASVIPLRVTVWLEEA